MPLTQNEDFADLLNKTSGAMARLDATRYQNALDHIPESWRLLDVNAPIEPKKKRINFYMDEDIHNFFTKESINWQHRVRVILRNYVALRAKKHLAKKQPSPIDLADSFLQNSADNPHWQIHKFVLAVDTYNQARLEEAINAIARAFAKYTKICYEIAETPDYYPLLQAAQNEPQKEVDLEELRASLIEKFTQAQNTNTQNPPEDDDLTG